MLRRKGWRGIAAAVTLVACHSLVASSGRQSAAPVQPSAMQAASMSGGQTGSILGRVTDATTGQPISGAAVSLGLPGGRDLTPPRRRSLTTAEGWFAIPSGQSGVVRDIVKVQADGYVNGYYGKFRPDDLDGVLPVAPGQRVADAAVKMWKTPPFKAP